MAESDSSGCAGVCGFEQETNSHITRSSVEDARARNDGVLEPAKLELRDLPYPRELHLTACDW